MPRSLSWRGSSSRAHGWTRTLTIHLICMTCVTLGGALSVGAQESPAGGEDAASRAEAAIKAAEDALPPRTLDVDESADPSITQYSSYRDDEATSGPSPYGDGPDIASSEETAQEPTAQPEAAPSSQTLPSPDDLFAGEDGEDQAPAASPAAEEAIAEESAAETTSEQGATRPEAALTAEPLVAPPTQEPPSTSTTSSLATLEVVQELFNTLEVEDFQRTHDLRRVVTDPRWDEALAMMAGEEPDCGGAYARAREIFVGEEKLRKPAPKEPAVAYALATMQECAGEEAAVKRVYRALATRDDAVGRLASRRLGRAVDLPEAPEVVQEQAPAQSVEDRLHALRRIARDATKLDAALDELSELRMKADSGWQWYLVRRTEAQILERAGRIEDAGQVWLSVYIRTRDWRSGSKIESLVEAFERRHRRVEVVGVGERLDRMRELIARGRYRDARQVSIDNAKRAGVRGAEIRGWSFYRRALQAERQREREEAVEMFAKADSLAKHPEVRPRLYFGWARALRRLDRDDEAIALYERLCHEYHSHHLCPDAIFEAGRLLQYHNSTPRRAISSRSWWGCIRSIATSPRRCGAARSAHTCNTTGRARARRADTPARSLW